MSRLKYFRTYNYSYKQAHTMFKFSISSITAILLLSITACGQENTKNMDFEQYDPVSALKVPEDVTTRAKCPFIDVHNHQWNMQSQELSELVTEMDKMNMKVMVNLTGGNGSGLKQMP